MKIVAVDPGGDTGVSMLQLDLEDPDNRDKHIWQHREFTETKHHSELYTYLSLMNPDVLLWEQFIDAPQEGVVETVSLEYIGVMELWLAERKKRLPKTLVYTYPPSKIKGFWTDEKLRRVNLYRTGSTHIRDTTRQVLTYLNDRGISCYVMMLKGKRS